MSSIRFPLRSGFFGDEVLILFPVPEVKREMSLFIDIVFHGAPPLGAVPDQNKKNVNSDLGECLIKSFPFAIDQPSAKRFLDCSTVESRALAYFNAARIISQIDSLVIVVCHDLGLPRQTGEGAVVALSARLNARLAQTLAYNILPIGFHWDLDPGFVLEEDSP